MKMSIDFQLIIKFGKCHENIEDYANYRSRWKSTLLV